MLDLMAIGPDVQVFISSARALLHYKSRQALSEEEQEELKSCVDELVKILSRDWGRHAETNYKSRERRKRHRKPLSRLIPGFLKRLVRPSIPTGTGKQVADKLPLLAHP
jgi:hypothetical protein